MTDKQLQEKIDKILDRTLDGKISLGYHDLPDEIVKLQNNEIDSRRAILKQSILDLIEQEKTDLRQLFYKYLTEDSVTKDSRKKEFNQAIFDAKEGYAIFNGTDLDMVLMKFDKAMKGKR